MNTVDIMLLRKMYMFSDSFKNILIIGDNTEIEDWEAVEKLCTEFNIKGRPNCFADVLEAFDVDSGIFCPGDKFLKTKFEKDTEYDIIWNRGGSMKVFDQYNFFKKIHALTRVKGLICNTSIWHMGLDNNYFNYQPNFWPKLLGQNQYGLVRCYNSCGSDFDDIELDYEETRYHYLTSDIAISDSRPSWLHVISRTTAKEEFVGV